MVKNTDLWILDDDPTFCKARTGSFATPSISYNGYPSLGLPYGVCQLLVIMIYIYVTIRILCGILIGYFLFHPEYSQPTHSQLAFYMAFVIFLFAELMNFSCHIILRNIRNRDGSSLHKVPYVSSTVYVYYIYIYIYI